jgi:hypothetical protein
MSTNTLQRGPGRPAVGVRVPVRLPADVLHEVDRRARILGRSRAAVIRSLLEEALGVRDEVDDGVDRAQIRRMLELSPSDRMHHMSLVAAQQGRLRRKARRTTR